ncbi:DUF6415 family natural product biosynthesis protein [Streptomyces sp. ST2-7A]|uniref:DUF6415 family natural product biosynthesis protein n=1 Tax=Streptomyces sp. ST2-7A TaxID=2907214 RepID=UPI001F1BDFB7|nr:DUF6415 family natural product biosynthesis protein [Streptomyces sp. ST2-7A]MCE7082939.1 DUF6415 family natural product biosynthesis protein [Streptomyces sp. ST2-7A]
MSTPLPHPAEVRRDVELALALANTRSTGPAVDALKARLRAHLTALLEPARRYATHLVDDHARARAHSTIEHATTQLNPTTDQPPADRLRLLAKATDHLARYAAAAPPNHTRS